jgi:hypothetical protein
MVDDRHKNESSLPKCRNRRRRAPKPLLCPWPRRQPRKRVKRRSGLESIRKLLEDKRCLAMAVGGIRIASNFEKDKCLQARSEK